MAKRKKIDPTTLDRVIVAGRHYLVFNNAGIIGVTEQLAKRGCFVDGRQLYMTDHYRAAADIIVRWALGDSDHYNLEIDEWFPSAEVRQLLLEILALGKPRPLEMNRLQKVEVWLSSQ